jgi:hypothetical protein
VSTEDALAKLAETKLSMGFMVRRELKKLPELLGEAEAVLNLARGEYDGKEGLIVTTDRRIMFVEQGVIRSNLEDFPYEKVSSVKTETGLRSGKITIFASGNKAELKDIHPKQRTTEIGDYVRGRIGAGSRPEPSEAAAPPPQPQDSIVDQLTKLGELRDAGILTADEFDAKKTELLARM